MRNSLRGSLFGMLEKEVAKVGDQPLANKL